MLSNLHMITILHLKLAVLYQKHKVNNFIQKTKLLSKMCRKKKRRKLIRSYQKDRALILNRAIRTMIPRKTSLIMVIIICNQMTRF